MYRKELSEHNTTGQTPHKSISNKVRDVPTVKISNNKID